MSMTKLDKAAWHPYLDSVTRALANKQAEIEVDSLPIGSQLEVEWLPLLGIHYDPNRDIAEIAVEGIDHLIHHPRELYVDQDALELNCLEVVDKDDIHHIVRLRAPLMLPAP